MAGLKAGAPTPQALTVHEQSRVLEVGFSDGATFRIPFELMRVYSPSAEVQGHGPGQEVLQTGKRNVALVNLEPVGNYAVKPTFSDGHDSGIFTWDYLYELGQKQDALWAQYTERLAAAGADRDAPMAPKGGGRGPGLRQPLRLCAEAPGCQAPSAAQAPVHQGAIENIAVSAIFACASGWFCFNSVLQIATDAPIQCGVVAVPLAFTRLA